LSGKESGRIGTTKRQLKEKLFGLYKPASKRVAGSTSPAPQRKFWRAIKRQLRILKTAV
jgi:hypothetical protein